MQLSFFATDDDLLDLIHHLIEVESFRLFEGYSRPDRPIREVRSAEDYAEIRKLPGAVFLRGWSPQFTQSPHFRQFNLNPSIGRERTALEGPGIVQLLGGRVMPYGLEAARLSHWNEAGARQRSLSSLEVVEEVDWQALRRMSGRVRRRVMRMAHGALGNFPVLSRAFASFERGDFSLWNFGDSVRVGSPLVKRLDLR